VTVNLVTVTGHITHPVTGAPANGVVRFRLPFPLRDPNGQVVQGDAAPIVAVLDVDGRISTQVPANDSTGVTPQGFAYTIEISTDVVTSTFYALVPSSPSTVDLSALVPVLIPPPVGIPGGGIVSVSCPDGSIDVGGTSTAKTLALSTDVSVAIGDAHNAAETATTTAETALDTAALAYQKPAGGIPSTDLSAGVQTLLGLAGTALQAVPPVVDLYAARDGGHSCNIPLFACNALSVISNEVWAALVWVEPGNPINGAYCFTTDDTAAVGAGGLNGFAVYPAAGGAKLGNSVSDDAMWTTHGKVDKPISGIATPGVRTAYWVLVSVRGYSDPPTFDFLNMGGSGAQSTAIKFGKYRGGGYTDWPSTLDPTADLSFGIGYILPVFLRA
jgi:hypothetical protein